MNAVGDNVGGQATIREHRAQNTGTAMVECAMVERTHGVEGMGRVPRSGRDSTFSRHKIGVGVSQAHANAAPRGFGNDLGRVLQFGSNRHHPNAAACRLPELLEQGQRRSQQIFRRVYPAPRMADEGPLKMDPERHTCTWDNVPVTLTVTEFLILQALATRPGVVKSRNALMDAAYDDQVYVDDRTIDSHIKRLRKKFKVVEPEFEMIETLYGVGYRFKEG